MGLKTAFGTLFLDDDAAAFENWNSLKRRTKLLRGLLLLFWDIGCSDWWRLASFQWSVIGDWRSGQDAFYLPLVRQSTLIEKPDNASTSTYLPAAAVLHTEQNIIWISDLN